jgi:hypothetical protein
MRAGDEGVLCERGEDVWQMRDGGRVRGELQLQQAFQLGAWLCHFGWKERVKRRLKSDQGAGIQTLANTSESINQT